jgi:hypothetical protein
MHICSMSAGQKRNGRWAKINFSPRDRPAIDPQSSPAAVEYKAEVSCSFGPCSTALARPVHIEAWKPPKVTKLFENPPPNISELATASQPEGKAKRRRWPAKASHGRTRPQLLTRDQLDGRTNAAKVFDRLCADIEADLGGRDQLSTIEATLIEAYAGAAVTLNHLNTRLALGLEIDLSQHAQAVSAMVRVASRLGLQRRAKTVESLQDYLARKYEATADAIEGDAEVQP